MLRSISYYENFYLIQAHKNPVQLRRLIDTINTSDSQFVIHIDLKSKLEDFTSLIKSDNIYFIKNRLDCIWGDYSQVLATINLIEELKNFGAKEEDRIVFLSGQDYPIKSSEYIKDFL
ncbi:hypothetical protein LDL59_03785 [Kaistella anthropi]|nr:hypothetical protein [Kaistella anthropi]